MGCDISVRFIFFLFNFLARFQLRPVLEISDSACRSFVFKKRHVYLGSRTKISLHPDLLLFYVISINFFSSILD